MVESSDVTLSYDTAPWRCAPYHISRLQAAPTPLIVLVLIAVNWIPIVLFSLSIGSDAGRYIAIVFFHLVLAFMIVSWSYTCCTDPGTAPEAWQRQMAAEVALGKEVTICRRSGLYKPPRSHFDSVTERLTLNMDHFCPWVVNTVGFYNRKFFMLFLVYANLTLLVALATLVCYAPTMWHWCLSEEPGGGVDRWFPGMVNLIILLAAIGIDAVLLLFVLGPFMCFHLLMAARNETTIEGGSNKCFDVGVMANLRSVFGRDVWTWPLPLYLSGPDGDGLHWPRAGDVPATGLRTAAPTRTANATSSSSGGDGGAPKAAPSSEAGDGSSAAPAAAARGWLMAGSTSGGAPASGESDIEAAR